MHVPGDSAIFPVTSAAGGGKSGVSGAAVPAASGKPAAGWRLFSNYSGAGGRER